MRITIPLIGSFNLRLPSAQERQEDRLWQERFASTSGTIVEIPDDRMQEVVELVGSPRDKRVCLTSGATAWCEDNLIGRAYALPVRYCTKGMKFRVWLEQKADHEKFERKWCGKVVDYRHQ